MPPHNIDAEQAVLGAILLDGEALIRVSAILTADDFYHEGHREIYRAALNLHDRGDAVDLVTVIEELRRAGTLDKIGGAAYVASLADLVPTTANVEYYARIVQEKALLRTLIRVAARIAEMGYEENESAARLVDQAEQMILELGAQRAPGVFTAIKDILAETWERIEQVYEHGRISGIPTGFVDLDRVLSGFQPADLIILAARPSMGKTSLAMSIAHQVARHQGLPVGIFSLEMSKEQLVQRLLCAEAMVDQYRLRTGLLREEDWERLTEAAATLARLPIYIDDTAACSVREMRAKTRRLKAEVGLGLVIVDYLQLMQPNRRAENRQQEIAQISRALKGLAKELNVPVLALSQLSRAVEQRQNKRPQLADLRESGSLEQDADVVMFIYRDEYYRPDTDKRGIAEIIVAKQRNGPVGVVEMGFLKEFTRFVNLARESELEEFGFTGPFSVDNG